jgi:hypothetical protein
LINFPLCHIFSVGFIGIVVLHAAIPRKIYVALKMTGEIIAQRFASPGGSDRVNSGLAMPDWLVRDLESSGPHICRKYSPGRLTKNFECWGRIIE